MQQSCQQCQAHFEITESDLAFYEKVSPLIAGKKYQIPPPTFCPDCRQQRRLCFRNERNLYNRACDLCKKDMVSIYSPDKSLTVYCNECWWSDKWDPMDYGKEFDFNRSLFEQFAEIKAKIPHLHLMKTNTENSEYTHLETDTKNCYMNFGGHYNEDCYYNLHALKCKNCIDNYWVSESEMCYECFKCFHCFSVLYSFWCFHCDNCQFCYDCKNCSDCFGCVGLRHKKYHIFNKEYSKEEYESKRKELKNTSKGVEEHKKKALKLWLETPHRAVVLDNCENSTGDFLKNCKNCELCFELEEAEDCKYCEVALGLKDCYDGTRVGYDMELCYENMAGIYIHNVLFSNMSMYVSDSMYTDSILIAQHHLFGCTNTQSKKQYCILNKQYTKQEYEKLVPKIIEHMQATGEWGEFFPASLAPIGYNETVASEYFPLEKEEALKQGFNWSDYESPKPDVEKIIPALQLPDTVQDTPNDILNWAIECEVTKKPFRIIKQELAFYRTHNIPIPRKHPDQRHKERMTFRNPRKLWTGECQKCNKEIQTTYNPERPEIIYCEECYLKEVY